LPCSSSPFEAIVGPATAVDNGRARKEKRRKAEREKVRERRGGEAERRRASEISAGKADNMSSNIDPAGTCGRHIREQGDVARCPDICQKVSLRTLDLGYALVFLSHRARGCCGSAAPQA